MSGVGANIARDTPIGVVGAGTMGAGIAQIAAAAGHPVRLYDSQPGAAQRGVEKIGDDLAALVAKGRMTQADRDALIARIVPVASLDDFSEVGLAIEAVVEDLTVKRDLVQRLEAVLTDGAIIATNTSSISITAIARDARRPERIAGLHFFNPAPVMKLVEIVSGVATAADVATGLFETAKAWNKIPVHARSTPGFIVNRVARPFYAEALRLYEEQVATPATIDALISEGAGFRMGPFALMDLIGHDVNYAVSCSVFDAYYQEPRFRPSIAQRELVDAGRLGRKSGHGFFDYAPGAARPAPDGASVAEGAEPIEGWMADATINVDGVRIALTDGQTAALLERDGTPSLVFDLMASDGARRVAFATSPSVPTSVIARFVVTLADIGVTATHLPDWPGLVVMRTVAMVANEGFEAILQGVASGEDVDKAMRHGVNYPRGPIEWAHAIGLERVLCVLDQLQSMTGDPRYRASLGLRLAALERAPVRQALICG